MGTAASTDGATSTPPSTAPLTPLALTRKNSERLTPSSPALSELSRVREERRMKEEKSSARKARKKGRKKEGEGGLGPPMKNRSRSQVLREEMESSMSRPVGRLAQAPAPPRSFPPSRRAAASVDISDDSFDSCDDRDSGGKWDSYMDKVEKRSYGIEVTSSPSKRKQPVGQQGFGNGNSSSGSESDGSFTHGPSAAPTRTTAAEREHHKAMKEKIRRTILTKKIAAKTKALNAEKEKAEMDGSKEKERADKAEAELQKLKLELMKAQRPAKPAPNAPTTPSCRTSDGAGLTADISSDESGDDAHGTFSKPVRRESASAIAMKEHLNMSSEEEEEEEERPKGHTRQKPAPPTPKNPGGNATPHLGPDMTLTRKPPAPSTPGRGRGGRGPGGRGPGRGGRGGRGNPGRGAMHMQSPSGRGGEGRGGRGMASSTSAPGLRPSSVITKVPSRANMPVKPTPVAAAVAAPAGKTMLDSDSDYGDSGEDYDIEEEDGVTYDYLAMDTAAGMNHIKEAEIPAAAARPKMTVNVEYDSSDGDYDDDDDLVDDLGEDAADVYDFLAFNTAAGMDQVEKEKKSTKPSAAKAAPLKPTAPLLKPSPRSKPKPPEPAGPPPMVVKTPSVLKKEHQIRQTADNAGDTQKIPAISNKMATPAKQKAPPAPASAPSTPIALGSPDPHAVKDTDKIKRKKASLPTNMPAIMAAGAHGNFFTNRYIVNNYILLDVLGTGSYAEVRLGKEKSTENELYAIKIMNKDLLMKKSVGMASTFMDDVRREIAIMKKLRHDNVLRLFEVMDDAKVNKLYLVLEYCKNGDLMQMTKGDARTNSCTPLSDLQIWDVFRQILKGLKYLHIQGIVHGDIKPQNLLVSEHGVIKIADFGISKMIQTSDGEKEKLLETAGTPAFMSPELCSGKPYDGNLADVYALGATMFMLRCGTPPFVANKLIVLYHKIQEDPVVFTTECASGFKNLILKMMEKVPEKRVSLDGVMKDKWLQSKPGEESGGPKVALSQADKKWRDEVAGSAEKVKLNSEDMMQSVHLAMGHAEKEQNGEGKAGVVNLAATMEETEMERRVRGFQKKGSIRQRSFETVDALVGKREEGKKEAIDSDDEDMFDFGDDDLEDEPISKLNSTTFNGMMDTLAHQTPPSVRKKQAPIPAGALTVGKVLDGLPNAAIGIRAAFYSEKGKRPNQEDTVTVIMDLSSLGDELSRPYLYQKFAFFGVFDGHGGGNTSKMLQHTLHSKLGKEEAFFSNLERACEGACEAADKEICNELRNMEDDSGSTAVFVILDGRKKNVVVGNVGDSRCVLSRGGTAIELTKDHRVGRKDEEERVLRRGCRIRDKRVNGVLAVTRSFGDVVHKGFKGDGGGLDAVPEVREEGILERDEFVILGTDGLWDVMGSQQVVNFVRLGLARHHKVKTICKELVKEAIRVGSIDNVSVVVVMLNQERGGEEGGE